MPLLGLQTSGLFRANISSDNIGHHKKKLIDIQDVHINSHQDVYQQQQQNLHPRHSGCMDRWHGSFQYLWPVQLLVIFTKQNCHLNVSEDDKVRRILCLSLCLLVLTEIFRSGQRPAFDFVATFLCGSQRRPDASTPHYDPGPSHT